MADDPLLTEALEQFADIMRQAEALELREPTAVALATATPHGLPSVRIVLLRGWDERGFCFFTNVTSRKGRELAVNPRAALCFHWEGIERQVRIDGRVELVSESESDAYWAGRARESQIGAWASKQSAELDDRKTLEERVSHFDAKYPGDDVPRPDFWRGYRVVPERIEFWNGLPARLHDRHVYRLAEGQWTHQLLYP
jgi:pyridoxamine 5'-phosphate oxidase